MLSFYMICLQIHMNFAAMLCMDTTPETSCYDSNSIDNFDFVFIHNFICIAIKWGEKIEEIWMEEEEGWK